MELDAMRAAWREHERKLDANLALNRQILDSLGRDRTRASVHRATAQPLFELVLDAIGVLLAGSFVGDHLAQPAMLVPGLVLLVVAIALTAFGVHQLVAAAQIDYGAPVVAIQRDVERLRALRLLKAKAILLAIPLLWPPLLIVGAKGLFGIDVYAAFGVPFVAAQVAFGVVALIGIVVLGRWLRAGSFWRRLRDDITGANLAAARTQLDDLARFARDD